MKITTIGLDLAKSVFHIGNGTNVDKLTRPGSAPPPPGSRWWPEPCRVGTFFVPTRNKSNVRNGDVVVPENPRGQPRQRVAHPVRLYG